jgi:hypothetical protein
MISEAHHREPSAGSQQPRHLGQRRLEVHVVQGRVGTGEVETARRERMGHEVGFDEFGSRRRSLPCALAGGGDHRGVPVDPGDGRAAAGELAGQQAVAASDVQSRLAAGRHGVQDQWLVVDVMVPVVGHVSFHIHIVAPRRDSVG